MQYLLYKQRYGKSLTKHQEPNALEQNSLTDDSLDYNDSVGLIREDFLENRLSRLVRKAYDQRFITLDRAAEILKIDINEMKERGRFWTRQTSVAETRENE